MFIIFGLGYVLSSPPPPPFVVFGRSWFRLDVSGMFGSIWGLNLCRWYMFLRLMRSYMLWGWRSERYSVGVK